ncbi:DUF6710 family protein [Massilia sp. LXY-6]|uniref:DUF6710 family protein n=1 Tax=Massilia sp. LXY-6 TaxID=3379823 RepID=UPI003EE10EBB
MLQQIASRITSLVKSQPHQKISANRETFRYLLDTANELASREPSALASLINAILRPLQSEHILSVAERVQHAACDPIDLYRLFSPDDFFSVFEENDCLRLDVEGHQLDLAKHIVMPTPWRRAGFVSALASIGYGKTSGQWRQDSNHGVTLLLPWHIGLVTGGNHSITAGILGHEGVLSPTDVLDFTPLLNRVVCDGDYFIDRYSNKPIARAKNGRMAALYEIGRLLMATAHTRMRV